MDRGSNKVGSKLNQEMEQETEALERSGKEGHVDGAREGEQDGTVADGHRISGTGSSADEYPYKDHGEVGGESHPKPKDRDS